METRFFQCLLCKKFKNNSQKDTILKSGEIVCKNCGIEIRNSFSYFKDGKPVTKEEFDTIENTMDCPNCEGTGVLDNCDYHANNNCEECNLYPNCEITCKKCKGRGFIRRED